VGGHQQGIINSELLSPIDRLDTSALDGKVVFKKAWDQLTIGFYDADGFYRTYIPGEKELQLSLAGIEQWSYFKKYQSAATGSYPPGFGLASDAGSVAAQDGSFQSRLDPLMPLAGEATSAGQSGIRIISNRRDAEHNWTLDFYGRVKNHATRHYGRTYIASGIMFTNASGLFRPIEAAWANVENQIHGGTLSPSGSTSGQFVEDYEINRRLGPVSPFITDDFRITAHCVLPANTVYGPLGDEVPASFTNWTEDAAPFNPSGDGRHYIPVQIAVVGQRVIDPRSDDLYSFERYPEGTLLCQLPNNAGPDYGLTTETTIRNLETLISIRDRLGGSGLLDIVDPSIVLNVYAELSGVAIPVESRTRYGQGYPTTWVSGVLNNRVHEEVQLDDQFDRVPGTGISFTEHKHGIIDTFIKASSKILNQSGRAIGNWIVMGENVSNILESLAPRFKSVGKVPATRGILYLGTLDGRWEIFKDMRMAADEWLMGFKSDSFMHAGYVWCPWIIGFTTPTVYLDDTAGRKGIGSLYGQKIVNAKFYLRGKLKP
jgi:hypothetical protein